ncbi:hypothetical protein M8494_15115 [Serratia ureilytica]
MLPATDWLAFERGDGAGGRINSARRVKAILTRGSGGRGYSPTGCEARRVSSPAAATLRTICSGAAGHHACAQPGGAGAQSVAGGG